MRIALTDLETTGLDPTIHEIVEMAVIVFDSRTLAISDTLEIRVQPTHLETASPKALEVNGYSEELWQDAVPLKDAMTRFALATAGCNFLAQNVIFDHGFIMAAANVTGTPTAFERPCLDLPSIAYGKIPHAKVQSWSLKTLATYLRIPPEPKVHRAMNGAMTAFEVYKKLMT